MALSSVYQVCFVTLETLLNMKRVGNNLAVLLDIEPMGLNKKKIFFFFFFAVSNCILITRICTQDRMITVGI